MVAVLGIAGHLCGMVAPVLLLLALYQYVQKDRSSVVPLETSWRQVARTSLASAALFSIGQALVVIAHLI